MKKKSTATPKPKTHFEQIPVKVVKKVVQVGGLGEHGMGNLNDESGSVKTEPYIEWKHSF